MSNNVDLLVGQDEPFSVMAAKLCRCRFGCWNGAKRFVARLAAALSAGQDLDVTLTDKQKDYLRGLRHTYRDQIASLPNSERNGRRSVDAGG